MTRAEMEKKTFKATRINFGKKHFEKWHERGSRDDNFFDKNRSEEHKRESVVGWALGKKEANWVSDVSRKEEGKWGAELVRGD
jgi:hypothetical protein